MRTLTFSIDTENFNKFENLRLLLYKSTKNRIFSFKNKFLEVITEEFKRLLISTHIYKEAPLENNFVIKKGRRRKREQKEYKTLSIGNVPDGIYQRFVNIGYSIVNFEENANSDIYSISYFIIKILGYIESNTKQIIAKYKIEEGQ